MTPEQGSAHDYLASPGASRVELESRERREKLRRRLLRANTAIAVILVTVLGLALAAVLASQRAAQNERRAIRAENDSSEKLWRSHLEHARAVQLSGRMGRRSEGIAAVEAAAQIRPSRELRKEAIALLGLMDLRPTASVWPIKPTGALHVNDRQLERYALADEKGDLHILRMSDNRELFQLPANAAEIPEAPKNTITGLQFSPDGQSLCVRLSQGGVVLWDLQTRQPVFRSIPTPHVTGYRLAAFSGDSKFFGFTDFAHETGATIVETGSGRVLKTVSFCKRNLFEFRPGQRVMAVGGGTEVKLWNWETEQLVQTLQHPSAVHTYTWSPSGKLLAVGCMDGQLYLWDMETGEPRVLSGHAASVDYEMFNHDETLLSTSGMDNIWRLWNPASGRLLLTGSQGLGVAFSVDGTSLAFERPGNSVGVWQIEHGTGLRALSLREHGAKQVRGMALSPDGQWLVAGSEKGLHMWELSGSTRARYIPSPNMKTVDFTSDGKALLLCTSTNVWQCDFRQAWEGNADALWKSEAWRFPPGLIPLCVAYSADQRRAAVMGHDTRTAMIERGSPGHWSWLNEVPGTWYLGVPASVSGARPLAFSPDGRWIASGAPEEGPRIWDTTTGKTLFQLSGLSGNVAFAPNGQRLLAGNYESAEWWELGAQPHKLSSDAHVASLGVSAFDAASDWVATVQGDQTVTLASLRTGKELASFTPSDADSLSGLSLAGGKILAAATRRDTIYVWNIPEIRHALAALHLDWSDADDLAPLPSTSSNSPVSLGLAASAIGNNVLSFASAGVAAAVLAGFFALVVLGRHRRLASEFLQAEELVLKRERELRVEQELGRLKGQFVSMVSHEFRTPLGIILSSADILNKYYNRLAQDRRSEHLADIMTSVARMKDLMESVLLLGRVEAGKMECCPAPLDLRVLCSRIVDEVLAATQSRCLIEFQIRIEGAARLDAGLVQIILNNLLSNAVKYSPAGKPVQLQVTREGQDAIFEIRDEGIGIPEVDQLNIFKSFHRASNAAEVPGTGLGLTIVKQCVDLHGGTITFSSAENCGTRFSVRLPGFIE